MSIYKPALVKTGSLIGGVNWITPHKSKDYPAGALFYPQEVVDALKGTVKSLEKQLDDMALRAFKLREVVHSMHAEKLANER